MASLHVATLTVQRELPNASRVSTLRTSVGSVPRMKPWFHFMWPH